MLFNSVPFLCVFLPLTLVGFHLVGRFGRTQAVTWLGLASLVFYGQWSARFLLLLGGSILFNFLCSRLLVYLARRSRLQSLALTGAIACNLGVLCFCKYLFPFLFYLGAHGIGHATWAGVALPLGISFFTFTQIGYLVDLRQGAAEPQTFVSYVLFVTFFPHLIAGPILHHKEIMPQLSEQRRYGIDPHDFAVGVSWFVLGLAKKNLFADRIAPAADLAFSHPHTLTVAGAWIGALTYSLQLYFDFSGYSDMALGLARMFSIRFPLNFNSPYKAKNIIDFWQRWHMTLTRYITIYLYNPMALAVARRRIAQGKKTSSKALATPAGFASMIAYPTTVTMALAGIWHGAGSQFLIFGLLHGIYLCVNHAWRVFRPKPFRNPPATACGRALATALCVSITFLAVLVGQVFFRANSSRAAFRMLAAMAGFGSNMKAQTRATDWSVSQLGIIILLFAIVWTMPNIQEILGKYSLVEPAALKRIFRPLEWRPNLAWALGIAVLLLTVFLRLNNGARFLYFQF